MHYNRSDLITEFGRWWSDPVSYTLAANGLVTISVPFDPSQWTSVYGKRGNLDQTTLSAFNAMLANPGNLGMTFGGGCFAGHGVNVVNGTVVKKSAKMIASTVRVKPKLKPTEDVYKKVAIPVDFLDANPVPELLLEFINLKPIVSTLNNLLAPVMQALGISVVRDDGSLNVTNTVDYY